MFAYQVGVEDFIRGDVDDGLGQHGEIRVLVNVEMLLRGLNLGRTLEVAPTAKSMRMHERDSQSRSE